MPSPKELVQIQLDINSNCELVDTTLTTIKTKCLLQTYFADLDRLRLRPHTSDNQKLAVERAKNIETSDNLIDLASQSQELTKLIGELAENTPTLINISEQTSKLLIHDGGVGTLISSTIGFATIPLLCVLEKRKPTPLEAVFIGLSITTIVLGSLAIAAVGGPIGVAAFVLAITAIGFGRGALRFFHEWRERKELEKEVKHLEYELSHLEDTLKDGLNNLSTLQDKLLQELTKPSAEINQKNIEKLQLKLNESTKYLQSTTEELKNKNGVFADKSFRLLALQEQRTSRWALARKGIYVGTGILAITGAILMLTPAAPIGAALMLTASILSVGTLIGSFIVNRIKNYQAQKSQAKSEHTLHQAQEIDLQIKAKPEHSSEYIIAQSLTPEGINVYQTLQHHASIHDDEPEQLNPASVSPGAPPINNEENNALKKDDNPEEEDEGEGSHHVLK